MHLARVVGEGGFEREVALKVMHDHLLHEPDFVAMFLDEARLAARIRHPNVVPTIDIQKTDESLFLVMEFVEGLALSSMIKQLRKKGTIHTGELTWDENEGIVVGEGTKKQVPLPLDLASRIALDMLAGLQAAHDLTDRDGSPLQLVHRDISPANVLVGSDGISRITDFGVARAETRLTATQGGQIKGKLPYMPPEQIMADAVDQRADLYSGGVVLWEMLTGRRLFNAEHQGALLKSVLRGTQVPPSTENPNVPPAVDQVCMRALALDAQQRFATAADFAESLEDAVRTSGRKVASAKRLATFVKGFETNAHRLDDARRSVPGSWPSSVDGGELVSSPSSVSASFARSRAHLSAMRTGAGPRPQVDPVTGASGVGPAESASGAAIQSAGPTNAAAVLSAGAQLPPQRSNRGLVLGVVAAALVVVCAAAVVIISGGLSAADETGVAATGETTTEAAPSSTAEPADETVATTSSTAATTTATAEVAVRPPAIRVTPQRHQPSAKPTATTAPKTKPDDSLPSDYLPPEL